MQFKRALTAGVAAIALLSAAQVSRAADKAAPSGAHASIPVTGDYLLSANEIIGQTVDGASGRSLATVDDVIITQTDHVVLAVLSVGGFFGINDRLVAIPYDRLSIGETGVGVAGLTEADLNEMAEVIYTDGTAEWLSRNRYMSRMDRTMNRWSSKIDRLYEASSEKAEKGATALGRETSEAWIQARASYRKLKAATGETWEDARSAFELALDELGTRWDRAVN